MTRHLTPDARRTIHVYACAHFGGIPNTVGRGFENTVHLWRTLRHQAAKRAYRIIRRHQACDFRLQSSEGKFTMSREIEPVRRSFCRHGSCTFTEITRVVPSSKPNKRNIQFTLVSFTKGLARVRAWGCLRHD